MSVHESPWRSRRSNLSVGSLFGQHAVVLITSPSPPAPPAPPAPPVLPSGVVDWRNNPPLDPVMNEGFSQPAAAWDEDMAGDDEVNHDVGNFPIPSFPEDLMHDENGPQSRVDEDVHVAPEVEEWVNPLYATAADDEEAAKVADAEDAGDLPEEEEEEEEEEDEEDEEEDAEEEDDEEEAWDEEEAGDEEEEEDEEEGGLEENADDE
ncbi:unnamed protein product [Closterium sp. NIES-64]|nr:unnamed protein product [Closterium sp. NIES-64]